MDSILIAATLVTLAVLIYLLISLQKLKGSLRRDLQSRLDHTSESSNTILNTSLQNLSSLLTENIQRVREENKETINSKFISLQENVNVNLANSRRELSESLTNLTGSLEGKFENLKTSTVDRLEAIRSNVELKLGETIEKSAGALKEVVTKLGDLKATNDRIVEISKDINQLSDILSTPKLRGNFGEFQLENMLQQMIPEDHYRLQENLGDATVDAVIILKEGMLCIDSKFPLENFRRATDVTADEETKSRYLRVFKRDVRTHIDTISGKYILPQRTLDFALMFVPAENVYYEIILDGELQQYAHNHKVIAVSPNTLYAFLGALGIGFRGMKIEAEARRIERILLALKNNFELFREHFRKIGKHLDNAKSQYNEAEYQVTKFDTTMESLEFGGEREEMIPETSTPGGQDLEI
ncbi:MAG: DNA recombination protein RmuC [Thermoplasmata archaeon]